MTAQEALARALETHYMDVLTIEQAIKPPDMDDDDPLGWRSDATAILAALPDHVLVSRDELADALWTLMKQGWRVKAEELGWTDLPPNIVADAVIVAIRGEK